MSDRRRLPDAAPLWVFGYGSLIWRPGFSFEEAVPARLVGMRRALCVYSTHYRGTQERPGLVFGLARGGSCDGMAFRVAAEQARPTIDYLNDRELITGIYRARYRSLHLSDGSGRQPRALCFVAETDHPQYAGHLTIAEQAVLVSTSRGTSGSNIDYVLNTLARLRELGIREPVLERLVSLMWSHALLRRATPRARCMRRSYPRALAPVLPRAHVLRANHRRNLGL